MKTEAEQPAAVRAAHPNSAGRPWSVEESSRLYGAPDWGAGYFAVNATGRLTVRPEQDPAREIDLHELVRSLRDHGVSTPVLLRFPQLLAHRARAIRAAFGRAIAHHRYRGDYTCVYPVKVNQHRHVVEEVRDLAVDLGFGLEVGAKPELLAVLGMTAEAPCTLIICNGFKDDEYIETVVLAAKLGRNIIPVVERQHELDAILRYSEIHATRVPFGLRIKLASPGAGRWQASGGLGSKFGLFVAEALDTFRSLKDRGLEDRLVMLHCHIGSQVCDLASFTSAVRELARVSVELRALGANISMIDVGGGLGVDYEGVRAATQSSINYDLDAYADTVIGEIARVYSEAGQPHPRVITESGRALVAYWSMLIFDVLGVSGHVAPPTDEEIASIAPTAPAALRALAERLDTARRTVPLDPRTNPPSLDDPAERLRAALEDRDALTRAFSAGELTLEQRALGERLFHAVGGRALDDLSRLGVEPPEPERLADLLCDLYFCNFSIFQSLPDLWALGQLFPFCPIHRLDERPTRRAVLCDITCDSDGEVRRFPSRAGEGGGLLLHEPTPGEPYDLGVFLVGAYQEILGDLHNLLGDPSAVHVSISDDGAIALDDVIQGDSVSDVLRYIGIDPRALRDAIAGETRRAVRQNRLSREDANALRKHFETGLAGSTYLNDAIATHFEPLSA